MGQFPSPNPGGAFRGSVGGISNIWSPADATRTRPANATAYAAGDALGSSSSVLFKWTNFFRTNGSSGLLVGLRMTASVSSIATSNMGAIRAHLFNAIPSSPASSVDQQDFLTLAADDEAKLGTVDFSTWTIGLTGSDLIEGYGTPILAPMPVIAAVAARDLYAVFVATGAFTPIASAILKAYASAALD